MRQTLVHSGGKSKASLLIASIGSYEIRMFRGPEFDFGGAPLFWLELFNLGTKTSVDGFSCHRIKDAVSIFDDVISQAGLLNEPGGAAMKDYRTHLEALRKETAECALICDLTTVKLAVPTTDGGEGP